MKIVTCGNCIYSRPGENGKGICFFDPPVPHPMQVQGLGGPQLAVVSIRPEVTDDAFCSRGTEAATMESQVPLKFI